jgi:purine/pyrimidine-nucleoside phosphorylase
MENKPVLHFDNVSVAAKANIYFDGKVISHSLIFKDGSKKTIGTIYPGSYVFNTAAPEKMEIISGVCKAMIKGSSEWKEYKAGEFFKVPANSSFEITVDSGITEYVCSFE